MRILSLHGVLAIIITTCTVQFLWHEERTIVLTVSERTQSFPDLIDRQPSIYNLLRMRINAPSSNFNHNSKQIFLLLPLRG
jgi:hypothetical protein